MSKAMEMDMYELLAKAEAAMWLRKINTEPHRLQQYSDRFQKKINKIIPDKVHQAITFAVKGMVDSVLKGSDFIGVNVLENTSLEERENRIRLITTRYSSAAALEGLVTGAGGLVGGIADFPLLLSFKMRFLSEVSGCYGYNVTGSLEERIYMLRIFELCFSKFENRQRVLDTLFKERSDADTLNMMQQKDWNIFQQEYRDYIDIAKLLQLLPVVGAPVGFYVNRKLVKQLAVYAMQCYRMRFFNAEKNLQH